MGALVSRDDPSRETIQCFQGEFETDENAKSQLTLTGDEAPDAVFPLAHVCLHKIRALSAVVSQRDKLNDEQKGHLMDRLLSGDDLYDTRYDDDADMMQDSLKLYHLMTKMGSGSASPAQTDVAHLFATFIPSSVRKPLHTHSDDSHSRPAAGREDDIQVEDIDFPYTPVTRREDSDEYHAGKAVKMDEMVMG